MWKGVENIPNHWYDKQRGYMDYRTDNDWGYRYSLCRQHSLLCSDKRQFLR